jgi:uncharacterized membrane protein YhfC
MISDAALGGLVLSFAISLIAPFAIYFALRRRMTLSWRNIGVGAAIFVVFALVLEQLLHYAMRTNPETGAWLKTHAWGFAVYGALAAALFEEGGRYVGLRFFVKPTGNPGTATAYGLGHGGIETLLIGALPLFASVVFALLSKLSVLDQVLAGKLPQPVLAKVHAQLSHLTFAMAAVGGFERLVAIGLQIAFSFVVWRAVEQKRPALLLAAIGFHAAADLPAGLFQRGVLTSVLAVEGWAFAVLVAAVLFLRALPRPAVPA